MAGDTLGLELDAGGVLPRWMTSEKLGLSG